MNRDSQFSAKRAFKNSVYGELSRIGKALSSAGRVELLDLLSQAERTVESLAEETGMTIANTSRHLQILQATRLVESRKDGRFVIYRVPDAAVEDFLRTFRILASERFAEIERARDKFLGDTEPIDREALLKKARDGKVVILDVRPREEYQKAHLMHARTIPLDELRQRLDELPRSKEIVAYCRGPFCILAHEAVELLRAEGFRARRLEDSVQDWRAHELPIVSR